MAATPFALLLSAAMLGCLPGNLCAQDRVEWSFAGRIADHNPSGEDLLVHEFEKFGTDGGAVEIQEGATSRAVFSPNAEARGATQTLKSGATIDVLAYRWDDVRARGISTVSYVDQLTVQADPREGLDGGMIAFTWGIEGKLSSELTATHPGGVMFWNYHVNARLAAVVTYPNAPEDVEIEIPFDESLTRGQLTNNQLSCLELLDTATFVNLLERDSIAEARSFDQGDRTYTVFVPYHANTPATLEMELRTCVNMRAAQLDINVVNPHSAAEFQHTASLLSVQVLDENMQPVTVPYELISGQG
jgi:hypothetical protein